MLEHAQMRRHGRAGHGHCAGEFADSTRSLRKTLEQRPSRGAVENGERMESRELATANCKQALT